MKSKSEVTSFFQRWNAHGDQDEEFREGGCSLQAEAQLGHIMHQATRQCQTELVPHPPATRAATPPRPRSGAATQQPFSDSLLPPYCLSGPRRKTLVLDLDETLVHSSFRSQSYRMGDLVLDIELDGRSTTVYVKLRPFLQTFLEEVAQLFEVVVFTASLSVYASPLIDTLDPSNCLCHHRLYREHCTYQSQAYIKDLSRLGRPLDDVVIVDNSPVAYLFQQRNAIPCTSWFEDVNDQELAQFIPMLRTIAASKSVYDVLDSFHELLLQQQ